MRVLVSRLLLAVVAASSCATLNTSGMSPRCRDQYDACLNACPRPPPAPPPGLAANAQVDVARCTNACNEAAKTCQ